MTKRTAVLQSSADATVAQEALDVALALASMDQPVQLILWRSATQLLANPPAKRYGMLALLDAEPTLAVAENRDMICSDWDIEWISRQQLRDTLAQFDEVLHFS